MYATDNTTFISGIGLSLALLMGFLMLVLPRRYALLPVLAMVCYMTMGQRLIILGLDFSLIRILILFGFIRVLIHGEARGIKTDSIGKVVVLWVISSIVTYTALWGTFDAFVNRVGLAYDALGLFFLFRFLVRDLDDVRRVLAQLAVLVIPLAVVMLLEKGSGRNVFAVFGGVPPETLIREGVLRCQGPFGHPILAGAFGSSLIPLFIGLWMQDRQSRILAGSALVAAMVIAATAGSSGPLMAAGLGAIGLACWPIRKNMRQLRWAISIGLVALHIGMKAPVWFLLARVSVFSGSTGYHRAILIDRAFDHFWDWWLIGTFSTAGWGYYMFDVTNQYVLIAVQGGLITVVLFIAIIARGFGEVGRATEAIAASSQSKAWLVWTLGASLMVHVANYISVPYFDQNIVNWYLLLAMICAAGATASNASHVEVEVGEKKRLGDVEYGSRPRFRPFVSPIEARGREL